MAMIFVIVVISVLLIIIILDGTFSAKIYSMVWQDKYVQGLENDQRRLIAEGIKASSSHNMQPWLVKELSEDKVQLFADMKKDLKIADRDHRQLLMGHGAFIENYTQAAKRFGYETKVILHNPNFNDLYPHVATISIQPNNRQKVDSTISASWIYNDTEEFSEEDLKKLLEQVGVEFPNLSYAFITNDLEKNKLREWLRKGTEIEAKSLDATKELLSIFQWTEKSKNKYRYGLTLSNIPMIVKPFAQVMMEYSAQDPSSFGKQSIQTFEKRLADERAYVLVCSREESVEAFIQAGRFYQHLLNEVKGGNIRPSVQVLQTYPEMLEVNKEFSKAYSEYGNVLLILGLQESTKKTQGTTPRHLVEDILIK